MDEKKLLDIIAEYTTFNVEGLKPEMNFADDLGIDSLDLAQIIMAVEDEYDVELAEEVLENVATVGDAIGMIKEQN